MWEIEEIFFYLKEHLIKQQQAQHYDVATSYHLNNAHTWIIETHHYQEPLTIIIYFPRSG